MTTVTLDDRELATVLAALRLWGEYYGDLAPLELEVLKAGHYDIVTNEGKCEPLRFDEIGYLCDRINMETTMVVTGKEKENEDEVFSKLLWDYKEAESALLFARVRFCDPHSCKIDPAAQTLKNVVDKLFGPAEAVQTPVQTQSS